MKTSLTLFAGLLTFSVIAMAQTSAFGQAAQGIATEVIATTKWIAIIVLIVAGLSIAFSHDHGVMGRLTTMLVALLIAIFAQPLVTWLYSI